MSPNLDLRVAGYQMPIGLDIERNTRRINEAIDWAADQGAEILLTPEGSLSGYTHEFDAGLTEQALGIVTARARDRKVGLALGTCFVEPDGKCYNQLRFYRPTGEYLGFHSKQLCCGSMDGRSHGEVNHFAVADLRVFPWRDGLVIGGLICNDLWANPECTPMPDPHLTQQLSAMGARVILHAVNGGRNGSSWSELTGRYHEANLRLRARAGGVWIATVDSAAPEHLPCSAPSGVIDRSGEFVCRTNPKGEQLFAYTITLGDGQPAAQRDVATRAP
ncbi:MAG TPA: carbon-nitrogen hydrolase family protein [Opitutaceae bacterium]|nr:carbon-nitrogen hydrolase family protein [Opitutaceae bacterium]